MGEFSHLDKSGTPAMVDVGHKQVTHRIAKARALISLPKEVMKHFEKDDIQTKKGGVFQTAIIAGIMGAKKTSELIPLCHPLALDNCKIEINNLGNNQVEIISTAKISGKTGVEMEALTGAGIAALTIYDMCKAFSHEIVISEIKLLEKSGGKSDFNNQKPPETR